MVVSSTPQREINNVAYSLSWSHGDDFPFNLRGFEGLSHIYQKTWVPLSQNGGIPGSRGL